MTRSRETQGDKLNQLKLLRKHPRSATTGTIRFVWESHLLGMGCIKTSALLNKTKHTFYFFITEVSVKEF